MQSPVLLSQAQTALPLPAPGAHARLGPAGTPPDPTEHLGAEEPGQLTQGLAIQATTGHDPLKMGIVGATDTHNATPGNVREDTFPGHVGIKDDTPAARLGLADFGPGGITPAVRAIIFTNIGVFIVSLFAPVITASLSSLKRILLCK